jgi:hypothetical protein
VLIQSFSGTSGIVTEPVITCTTKFYLIVTVYDQDNPGLPKLPKTVFDATCSDGGSASDLPADDQAHFTLVFDSQSSLLDAEIRCTLKTYPPAKIEVARLPRYLVGNDRAAVSANVYRAGLFIGVYWTVRVEVLDALPSALRLAPVPLAMAPVHFAWDGKSLTKPVTGNHGEPFTFSKMDVGTRYTVTAPVDGAIAVQTVINVNESSGQLQGSDYAVAGERLAILVPKPGLVVDIRFVLAFEKVFIVGEGNHFAFAAPLAKKYFGPDTRYASDTANFPYAAKGDKKKRKWIVASQYDVDDPAETVQNLFIYRDAQAPKGLFNAIDQSAWMRLAAFHGADFEAVLFNNPHPGYGMHVCEVMGMDVGEEGRGRYISVHTIGSSTLVGLASSELAVFYKAASEEVPVASTAGSGSSSAPKSTADEPAFQRHFVQGILKIIRDGSDPLMNFAGLPPTPLGIPSAFDPCIGYAFNAGNFIAAQTHYNPTVKTIGLKYLLLGSYARYGMDILKGGGLLCVNGSTTIAGDLKELGLDKVLKSLRKWKTEHKVYFVSYSTNFTSPQIHPSWLSNTRFKPGEPELDNATVYGATK